MVFENLSPKIRKAIKKRGFVSPTEIQKLAIPKILKGKNVLLIAPTGTGKSEGAWLPIFHKFLKQKKKRGINILHITPLRALNRDLIERIQFWAEELDIDAQVRHGDTTQHQRRKQALESPSLLVTTPETLNAILPGSRMKEHLSHVKYVVVDEIHSFAGDKRGAHLSIALERLRELAGDFQLIGLSATVGSPERVAKFLVGAEREVEVVQIPATKNMKLSVESPPITKLDKRKSNDLMASPSAVARVRRIHELANEHKSSLIFVNTRHGVELLSLRMRLYDESFPFSAHHSSLSKDSRIGAEKKFKNGELKSIICTTSLELGLDIGSIDLVMQYMSPRQVTELTQKVGRSGHRLGRTAKGVIISSDKDDILESIVIAKETLSGSLEPVRIHENALDALAHQIAGMTLDEYKIDPKRAYQIVKRAYPYRNLSFERFNQVVNQLKRERLIWVFEDGLRRRRNTWRYYYSNLSMIPDQRSFRVINITDRSRIGVLDEEFVVRSLEKGGVFIIKGKPWRVVDISDEIYVEPVYLINGAIPAWEGELMPVMYEVAQRVGELRKEIAECLKNGKEKAVEFLVENYPLSKYTAYKAVSYVQEQIKKGKLPTEDNIVVESFKNFVILHSCFGSLVNETLGRALSSKLTSRFGESVRMKTDQYRILFELPVKLDPKEIIQMIKDLEPDKLKLNLESALYKSQLLRWRVLHTAKKFGAVRQDVEYGRVNMRKLTGMFFDTPIYDEALRWTFVENLDLEKTKEIIKKIKEGKIKLILDQRKELSPFAEGIFGRQLLELIAPKKAEKKILETLEERLLDQRVTLLCLYCLDWRTKLKVKNIKELICPKCNSRLITALQRKEKEYLRALKKRERGERLTKEEEDLCSKARRIADLVLSYDKKAILALSAYGIGPETASRILSKNLNKKEFLKEILEAEKQFIRTKRFWS